MTLENRIRDLIKASMRVKCAMLADNSLLLEIDAITKAIVTCYKKGGKVFFCGNGGSMAVAQHLAAELIGRFAFDRPPLQAEAFTNASAITAIANDYGFEHVFSRQIENNGREGDVLIAISTSGHSRNIITALGTACEEGMVTIGFTGKDSSGMKDLCDHLICVPSEVTPRIQECHILIGHIICEMVEKEIFSKKTFVGEA